MGRAIRVLVVAVALALFTATARCTMVPPEMKVVYAQDGNQITVPVGRDAGMPWAGLLLLSILIMLMAAWESKDFE